MPGSPTPGMPRHEAVAGPPMPAPSIWKVLAVIGGIVLATAAVVIALWWAGTAGLNGDKLVTARLDALRTGLSIGLGGGGALALYLSWRRQRAAEITLAQAATALVQKDRDYDHTESDARERRITDLYTKAVEQLGSDKAPVRLGGLYALERLAQDNPPQRQTIVNVLCAYLRMPYTLPGQEPDIDADSGLLDVHRERVQEREVRLTAQRILTHHLRRTINPSEAGFAATYWPNLDLDLTKATLIDFSSMGVTVDTVDFTDAQFVGSAYFFQANFTHVALFGGARFRGPAQFELAKFDGYAGFGGAIFDDTASFGSARFNGIVYFEEAKFEAESSFNGVNFKENVMFTNSAFSDTANFIGTNFRDLAAFKGARFDGGATFESARFSRSVPVEVRRCLPEEERFDDFGAGDTIAEVDHK